MLETNITGDRSSFSFSNSSFSVNQVASTYALLGWMKFIFDKRHVVHKGFHDHFNPQVFMNKQGGQTIDVCGIERQPRRYDVVNVKIHVRPYDVVYKYM